MIAFRPCPVCSSRQVTTLHLQRFVLAAGSPLPTEYAVVACDSCGMVYADTHGSQKDYDRYYESFSKYDDPRIATGGGEDPLDRERLKETADLLAARLPNGIQTRMLDLGCAGGGLLEAMAKLGLTALTGIDPSPVCVERVKGLGIQASRGLVTALDLATSERFDLITLSHVLEHVVDVKSTMTQVGRLLSPTGLLYIEVPDASRYREHPFVPFYFFDAEHINHFASTTLENLAAANGLRLLDSSRRDLRVAGGARYPAVWALMTPNPDGPSTLRPTAQLRSDVAAYIAQSTDRSHYPSLAKLANSGRPVALWGAGSFTQRLLLGSPLGQCRIIALVDRDSNKHGHPLAGLTITSPEEGLAALPADTVIVIASVLHAAVIAAQIRALGVNNDILFPDSMPED